MGVPYTGRKIKIFVKSKYQRRERKQKIFGKLFPNYLLNPAFSDKSKNSERIVLRENDETAMKNGKVALALNTFFFFK